MTSPGPVTPARQIETLRRAWFVDRAMLGSDRMDVLQAWHDAGRHQQTDPTNGGCFFCCGECDPR